MIKLNFKMIIFVVGIVFMLVSINKKYGKYKEILNNRKILIEKLNGDIVALEKASTIVESITKGQTKKEGTIFFPK